MYRPAYIHTYILARTAHDARPQRAPQPLGTVTPPGWLTTEPLLPLLSPAGPLLSAEGLSLLLSALQSRESQPLLIGWLSYSYQLGIRHLRFLWF